MYREVIDVDDSDVDVVCTGVRHARIDPPPPTISLVDSDNKLGALSCLISPSHAPTDQSTELQRITQSELGSRTALRPTKRRAMAAMKMATDIVKIHNDVKRKDRVLETEVIEISSDSEPESWPSKRQRVDVHVGSSYHMGGFSGDHRVVKLETKFSPVDFHSPNLSDGYHSDSDDDDCMHFMAALDISNDANWAPLPERNKAEYSTPTHELDASKSQPVPSSRVPRKKPPIDYHNVPLDWLSLSPWGTLSRNCSFPKPFHHARRQERLFPCRSPSLHYEKGFTKLELTAKYPHLMSGSVNKIIQGQDSIVIGAVVEGGLEESDDDDVEHRPPPPENRAGSLVVYHHGRVHVPPAHCHPRRTSRDPILKYYSVNDVAFNPLNPRQFLSSGNDLVVQTWEILDQNENDGSVGLCTIRDITFDSRPQDLVYAPDGTALVITCYDGTVWLYSQDLFEDMIDVDVPSKRFRVAPKGSGHATGATLWGKGPSKQLLFSSSEPKRKEDYSGFHHAFDTCRGTRAFQFDATEAGDAATLSPDGTTLVLFTTDKDNVHPVRLYDVRRKRNDAYETEELERFQLRPHGFNQEPGALGEVNQASFSPDGCLLAVARNDNALHVYDVRAISRGPLCRFEHHDSDAVGCGGFGIVAANWIQGRDRIGIVSGGNDGCVRLWEPALGSTDEVQGMVIGRTDFDVGHFSIGNSQSSELPLVIGDSGGGVQTYDFTNVDGIRI